ISPAPRRPRNSPVDRGAVPLTLNPAATPRSSRAVRFDIENWPIRDWLTKNWRKPVSYVFPEGLILLRALLYTHSHWLQNALGAFADLYPYAIFGAGVLLGWRFHRSRLLFALLLITTVDRTLVQFAVGYGLGRDHVVVQAIAVLLPLNLSAPALTAARGCPAPPGRVRWALLGLT